MIRLQCARSTNQHEALLSPAEPAENTAVHQARAAADCECHQGPPVGHPLCRLCHCNVSGVARRLLSASGISVDGDHGTPQGQTTRLCKGAQPAAQRGVVHTANGRGQLVSLHKQAIATIAPQKAGHHSTKHHTHQQLPSGAARGAQSWHWHPSWAAAPAACAPWAQPAQRLEGGQAASEKGAGLSGALGLCGWVVVVVVGGGGSRGNAGHGRGEACRAGLPQLPSAKTRNCPSAAHACEHASLPACLPACRHPTVAKAAAPSFGPPLPPTACHPPAAAPLAPWG